MSVFLNSTSKLYETWTIQSRTVCTFLKDLFIAEDRKADSKGFLGCFIAATLQMGLEYQLCICLSQ